MSIIKTRTTPTKDETKRRRPHSRSNRGKRLSSTQQWEDVSFGRQSWDMRGVLSVVWCVEWNRCCGEI